MGLLSTQPSGFVLVAMFGDASLSECSPGSSIDLVVRTGAPQTAVALWNEQHGVLHSRSLYGVRFHEFREGYFQLKVTMDTQCFQAPDEHEGLLSHAGGTRRNWWDHHGNGDCR